MHAFMSSLLVYRKTLFSSLIQHAVAQLQVVQNAVIKASLCTLVACQALELISRFYFLLVRLDKPRPCSEPHLRP